MDTLAFKLSPIPDLTKAAEERLAAAGISSKACLEDHGLTLRIGLSVTLEFRAAAGEVIGPQLLDRVIDLLASKDLAWEGIVHCCDDVSYSSTVQLDEQAANAQ